MAFLRFIFICNYIYVCRRKEGYVHTFSYTCWEKKIFVFSNRMTLVVSTTPGHISCSVDQQIMSSTVFVFLYVLLFGYSSLSLGFYGCEETP